MGESSRKNSAWPCLHEPGKLHFLGSASDVEMDSAGRILISPELRKAAGLTREVMLLGMGSHFEIWDAAKLMENEAEAIASGMPEALQDFSF